MRSLAAAALALVALTVPAPVRAAGDSPVQVTTFVSPDWVYFADQVTVRVDVVVDRSRVVPGSVVVEPRFGRWQQSGPPRVSTSVAGAYARRSDTFTLTCMDSGCLPHGTVVQPFRLPPVTVRARTAAGRTVAVRHAWPAVNVAGRFLPPMTGNVQPVLQPESVPPPASYRVDPPTLSMTLDAVGALLLALALALAVRELVAVRRRRDAGDVRPPLVRALALLRQASVRDVDDRRRAAGLVARLVRAGDDGAEAAELAWSRHEPSAVALERLADEVEAKLRGRS